MLKKIIAAGCCAGIVAVTGCRTAEFTAVAGGSPQAVIVVADDAVPSVRQAARELQSSIFKMTGATLPVVGESAADPAQALILLGDSGLARELGFRQEDFSADENLIYAAGNRLLLYGLDEPEDYLGKFTGRTWTETRYYLPAGTLQATYRLLEEFAGFRWYWPGETGEVVPAAKDFTVPEGIYRHRPAMGFRSMFAYWLLPEKLWSWPRTDVFIQKEPRLDDAEVVRWGRQLGLGGEPFACNHNQDSFHARFGQEHPDWFANATPQAGNQLCYSNPEVLAQVVQDARDFFDGKTPHDQWNFGDYYSVMPSDTSTWCQCDGCRPQYRPDLLNGEFSNGHVSDYVWNFVVKVANEVKKTHPDKSIACCAYWEYFLPPEIDLPDNVAVMICKLRLFQNPDYERYIDETVEDWSRKTKRIYFWDYYLFPESPAFESYPQLDPRRLAKEIDKMRSLGLDRGMMMQMDESFLRNPVFDHLRIYVSMKLMDDPSRSVDELLDEYYRLFYGPAEAPMREFWDSLESIYYGERPESAEYTGAEYDWLVLCPPEQVARFGELIETALAATPEGSVYRKRVELVRDGVYQPVLRDSSRMVIERLAERKTLSVKRASAVPAIDGSLDEEAWRAAAVADGWSCVDGGPLQRPTLAKIMYDDDYLYVAFECQDAPGYRPQPDCQTYNGQVYLDDSVEIFIDVDRTLLPNNYYQLACNTVPVLYETRGNFQLSDWRSDSRFASRVSDGGWTVEMAIPLAALGVEGIEPGAVWGINFCRNLASKNVQGFGSRFMNWSGPSGYHNPGRNGIVTFE